jgi:hypothetical protein
VAIVLSALIGGGVGDAASISAVDEFSISTTRLRRMGGHPMKLDARWTRTAAFISGNSTTGLHGTAVVNIQTEAVGRTRGAKVLASLARMCYLVCWPSPQNNEVGSFFARRHAWGIAWQSAVLRSRE